MSSKFRQYLAAAFAANGAFICGIAVGWSSPATKRVVAEQEYGFKISFEQFSWVSSIFPLGAVPGGIIIGFLINIIGRKKTMLLLYLPYLLSYVLITFAHNYLMLLVGRFTTGIAIGGFSIVVPVYIGEISEKEIRGALGTFYQILITSGVLFVFILGPFVSLFVLNMVSLFLPILLGVPFVFMPESPLYLSEINKKDEALRAIKWLRGSDSDHQDVLADIDAQLASKNNSNNANPFIPLKEKAAYRAIFITLMTMAFQQLGGIKAVIFYTTEIFRITTDSVKPEVGTIIIGATQVLSVLVASFTVDKAGRRVLLLISALGMTLCNVIFGLYFYLKTEAPETSAVLKAIPIASLCLFIVFYSIGYGPIAWVLIAEMFSPDVKGIASALGSITHWLLSFVVAKLFITLGKLIGMGPTFWIFGGITILAAVFTALFVIETRGLTLSEIIEKLEEKSRISDA